MLINNKHKDNGIYAYMKTKGDKYCDTGDYKNAMKRSEHGDADAQKHHRSNVVTGVELERRSTP
jgi:hypothetical protein